MMVENGFSPMMFPTAINETNAFATQRVPRTPSIKVKFTEAEDQKLSQLVSIFGPKDWITISKLMDSRNPRQCRERWKNYLNPELRRDPWTPEEDRLLCQKHDELGAKWNKIARFFNNRSDNSLRNRWMLISRRKSKMQNDSVEHKVASKEIESSSKLQKQDLNHNNYPKVEILPYVTPSLQTLPVPDVQSTVTSPPDLNDFSFPDEGLFDSQLKFGNWDIFPF
ncbi:Myb-like DNA-binding domain containing protein [Histomonas meleagridis]|uniref:Myb-like DNA-binding domain containing protein n=1 Tax=Histomonas meleagridis TaxID=135588 RepID=UPI00355A786E|nr:Myb-like DNA-binding domain containing protein [Histomonas meleagridis]KAH0797379.1 Myb-like DNA-binding domain containing protein [Histomonas meleagridis]